MNPAPVTCAIYLLVQEPIPAHACSSQLFQEQLGQIWSLARSGLAEVPIRRSARPS
jgi:hypothetical protein